MDQIYWNADRKETVMSSHYELFLPHWSWDEDGKQKIIDANSAAIKAFKHLNPFYTIIYP